MALLGKWDYVVLIGMLLFSFLIGVYYAWVDRKKQSNDQFLKGGKQMSVLPVAMSLVATFVSPILMLGFPAEVYSQGSQMTLAILIVFIATAVAAEIFLPVFFKLNLTSVNRVIN